MSRYVHAYQAPSGQWSGKVLVEIAGVAGCESAIDVMLALQELYPDIEPLPGPGPLAVQDDSPQAL
jgi:hypothetical protein